MNKEKEQKSAWIIYSITLHALIIIALLISLNDTSLLNPKKEAAPVILMDQKELRHKSHTEKIKNKEPQTLDPKTFTVPAPVMYYGHEIDPHKKPGNPTEKKIEASPDNNTHDSIEKKDKKESDIVPELPITEPEKSELSNKEIKSDNNESMIDTIIEKNIFMDDKKFIPLKKTRSRSTTSSHEQSCSKKLTLADLFKKSPLVTTDTQMIGEGSGQPIVIKEGDMKYYSVWTKFLHHLNQTARFNRIKKKVPLIEWIKTGQLKKDLFCGITVTKEGKVLSIDIISSSGFKPFDTMCIEDIWASSPFPPLPESMGKEQARFEVRSYL